MQITLDELVQKYRDDVGQQVYTQARSMKRDATLPKLRDITLKFVRKEIDLRACRDQLDAILREGERWGLQGYGFMGTLSLFIKHHDDKQPVVETFLRDILSRLNTESMGVCIEEFYTFLRGEQTRLRREGKSSRMAAALGADSHA